MANMAMHGIFVNFIALCYYELACGNALCVHTMHPVSNGTFANK